MADSNSLDFSAATALLEQFVSLGAPTFQEKRRSDFVLEWLRNHGATSVEQDSLGNVWVDLSGGADRVALWDAHIDTVFPYTEVSIRREGERWFAPGIFDDGAACVLLMLWARKVLQSGKKFPAIVSFTVGEEGEGNLCGIRAIAEKFRTRLVAGLIFDLEMEVFSHETVGSLRYALEWTVTGGHSWNNFGSPSAIHAAAEWISRLAQAFPWQVGERTFNVGTISGGTGVNVIAQKATVKLDVRSTDPGFLADFSRWFAQQEAPVGVEWKKVLIGDRPAGSISETHPLVEMMKSVHEQQGLPLEAKRYSTNANALLGLGIPAVTSGIASGAGVHTEKEYLEVDSLRAGYEKLLSLEAAWEKMGIGEDVSLSS